MLHWYTYLFPLACILLIAMAFAGLPDLKRVSLDLPGKKEKTMGRKDLVILLVITLLYGCVAFIGLGGHTDPESFYRFEYAGSSAVIYAEEPVDLTAVRYYCGVNEGNLTLEISRNGTDFENIATLTHSYSDIFKWVDAELSEAEYSQVTAIRFTADAELYLGEIGLYGSDGELIPADRFSSNVSYRPLLDEQDTVPEAITFMNSTYFDEVYHVRTAYEHLHGLNPYEISHPPLGKIILSLGISLFGLNPFGWRFMGTLFGILMLPAIYLLLKRLFGGLAVPACGTILLATDFMHFVHTRIATVDTYSVFFIILMFLFMYEYMTTDRWRSLALSGICFGLGAACKWTSIYAGVGLAVLWCAHWIAQRKDFPWKKFFKNVLFCILFFVLIPCVIYYCSYYYYGVARGWHGAGMYFTRDYMDMVLSNQDYMFSYHKGVDQTHAYSSRWYQWVLDIRPILYYLDYSADGISVTSFGAWLNPVLCWAGLIAIFVMFYLFLARRDMRAGFILTGYLVQLVPWMIITRTTFEYHYFGCSIFLVLAVAYAFDMMVRNRKNWKIHVFGLTALSLVLFFSFYPILAGTPMNRVVQDTFLGWLPTWPF